MIGLLGIGSTIANAAKNLFSGEAKAARQERRDARQAAKEVKKATKNAAKAVLTGESTQGKEKAKMFFNKVLDWIVKNWMIVVGGLVALYIVWKFIVSPKGRKTPVRRRRTTGKGSAAMRARMAKVRAARRRKRK